MKFDVVPSNRFKKDLKLVQSRGYDIELLTEVIEMLADGKELPAKYRDHALVNSRNYKNKLKTDTAIPCFRLEAGDLCM